MPVPDARIERRALLVSIGATSFFGVLGVLWGLLSGSRMILLDGAYAIVGIALSLLLLRASHLSRVGPTKRYPYGREGATPLVIAVQGLVLLGTLLFAGVDAIGTIREGGATVAAGWAITYSAIGAAASFGIWIWLRSRSAGSDLVTAETIAWRVSALRGVGMLAGFLLMWILEGSSWDSAVPYVDPVMVLITCVAFAPGPLAMVRATGVELLEGAPPDAVQEPVREALAEVRQAFGLGDPSVRIAKLGPKLYVEIEAPARPETTIATEHAAREQLRGWLAALPYDVWLTFELFPAEGAHGAGGQPQPPPGAGGQHSSASTGSPDSTSCST